MNDLFYTYGPPELCAWQVAKLGKDSAIFWVQTTNRLFARKLSKRRDTSRVAISVTNRFLETYAMQGSWRKVKRIIDRYILSAGDCISAQNAPQDAVVFSGRVMTAGRDLVTGDSAAQRVAQKPVNAVMAY